MPRKKEAKKGKEHPSPLSDGAKKLLELIPKEGSITNEALKHKLRGAGGFPTKQYWDYRKELIVHNLIRFGLGRGGSVLLNEPADKIEEVEEEKPEERKKEREPKFHVIFKDYLENNDVRGIRDRPHSKAWVAVTGNPKGWKRNSGYHSRPDVMMVSHIKYKYLPADATVTTYEMKRREALDDTKCVFEAASHQKGAHFSYVICETTEKQKDGEELSPELLQTLDRFGIGFGWFYLSKEKEKEYELEIVVEPKRQNPNPEDENKLLEDFNKQLPETRERAEFEDTFR
jgi:hypothetical protein